jgi:subtilisin-like proprotein convertase family protein
VNVKTVGRGALIAVIFTLVLLVILDQAGNPSASSAAGLTPTGTSTSDLTPTEPSPTPTQTPEPPDTHLPFVAKQPTLTPTPTNTPTSTPTKTNTPTAVPTVLTSAQFCSGPFLEISTTGTPTVQNTISISGSGTIVDVDVYINTEHSWVGDLRFSLIRGATTRFLINRPGEPPGLGCSGDDISAILNDSAALPVESQCSSSVPTISGTFSPNEALSGFNNQGISGSWTMKVEDVISGDGGTFNGWCLFLDYTTTP